MKTDVLRPHETVRLGRRGVRSDRDREAPLGVSVSLDYFCFDELERNPVLQEISNQ